MDNSIFLLTSVNLNETLGENTTILVITAFAVVTLLFLVDNGLSVFEKVWDNHLVDSIPNGPSILYIDKHLIHEVTSPQAFAGLKKRV